MSCDARLGLLAPGIAAARGRSHARTLVQALIQVFFVFGILFFPIEEHRRDLSL